MLTRPFDKHIIWLKVQKQEWKALKTFWFLLKAQKNVTVPESEGNEHCVKILTSGESLH